MGKMKASLVIVASSLAFIGGSALGRGVTGSRVVAAAPAPRHRVAVAALLHATTNPPLTRDADPAPREATCPTQGTMCCVWPCANPSWQGIYCGQCCNGTTNCTQYDTGKGGSYTICNCK